jgi:membrane protein DedA with SNARE-associated domain
VVAVEALGVPVPGETALILGGLAASQGRLSIVACDRRRRAAAIVGDNIGFQIGRRGGRALLERPGRFYEERQRVIAIGDPFFERHGPKAVFLGRWITGLRVWASWLAGASDMRWPTFLVWNALGGTAWAASVSLAAYYGGKSVEHDTGTVGRSSRDQGAMPAVGDHREGAARVVLAGASNDELLALQPVDEPRETATTEQHRFGELTHPHPPIGLLDPRENLKRTERETVSTLKLAVERLDERRVGAKQAAPSSQFSRAELILVGADRRVHGETVAARSRSAEQRRAGHVGRLIDRE